MTSRRGSPTECYSRKISECFALLRLIEFMGSLKTKIAQQLAQEKARQYASTGVNRSSQLWVLIAAGCLTTMTGTIIAPVFPEMLQQMRLEPAWAATLAVSMHEIAIALFTPLMGLLADRIGKLTVLLPGLLLYAVFGVAGSLMSSLPLLLFDRALLGIASASIAAASIGLLGTLYHGDERTRILGYATSAMTTASIVTLLIGGWVGTIQWQFSFYLYALSLPVAMLAFLLIKGGPSTSSPLVTAEQGKQLKTVVTSPDIVRLYLTIALAATIMYTVIVYAPIYLNEVLGANPGLRGTVLGIRAVGVVITSAFLASRLAKAIGTYRTISLGFLIMAVTLATIPLLVELHWIMVMAVGFGVGFGVVIPNTYDGLSKLAPPAVQATVLALGTGMNALGKFLCPVFLGPVREFMGLAQVFYVAAAVACLVGIFLWMSSPSSGRDLASG